MEIQRFMQYACALICFLSLVVGCSNSGQIKTAKVRGKVTFQNQPVPNAVVSFAPQAATSGTGSRGATGTTDAEGRFTLTTYTVGDGAAVGKHQVSVGSDDANKPLPGKTPLDLILEVTPGSNDFVIELVP